MEGSMSSESQSQVDPVRTVVYEVLGKGPWKEALKTTCEAIAEYGERVTAEAVS